MISAVSSVNFKANTPVVDPLSRPGAFTRTDALPQQEVPKKKGSFFKKLAVVLAAAAAISGALIYGARNNKWFKPIEGEIKNAKFMEKVSHYLNTAGKAIDTHVWTPVANFFTGLPAKIKGKATTETPAV